MGSGFPARVASAPAHCPGGDSDSGALWPNGEYPVRQGAFQSRFSKGIMRKIKVLQRPVKPEGAGCAVARSRARRPCSGEAHPTLASDTEN